MDSWTIGWLVVAVACFAWILGAGMGYYAAQKDEEDRRKSSMRVTVTFPRSSATWVCRHPDGKECTNCR